MVHRDTGFQARPISSLTKTAARQPAHTMSNTSGIGSRYPLIRSLSDGTLIDIRPITREDFDLEEAFVAGLSSESSYNRLHSTRRPDRREIERWTDFDTEREKAVIATTRANDTEPETMLGVARFVREDRTRNGEFAIVVGDHWKRCGVGAALISELISLARQDGIDELYGMTLSDNLGMQELANKFGFTARRPIGDPSLLRLSLTLAT